MKTIRDFLALSAKELRIFWTDKGTLAVLFLMPVLLSILLVGIQSRTAWSGDDGEGGDTITLNVVVVNEDIGEAGKQMADTLAEVDVLQVTEADSAGEAGRLVTEGEAAAAVIIPAGFSDNIAAYEPSEVRVIIDPTQPESAGIVTGIVNNVVDEYTLWGEISHGVGSLMAASGAVDQADPALVQQAQAQTTGVIMTQLNAARREPLIVVASENVAGEETENDVEFMVTTMQPTFAVMFAFFLAGTISMSLFAEKENGAMRRMLSSPIGRRTIVLGRMPAYMLVVALQVLLVFAVGSIFGMVIGESPLGLLLVTLALGLAVTGLGALLAAFARDGKQADSLSTLIAIVLAGISGAIPVGALHMAYRNEGFLGVLARLTPHAHALEGYVRIMAEGGGVVDVLVPVGILLAMSAIFYALAFWRFRYV
jgi:ABC-2 type transport system permease protein